MAQYLTVHTRPRAAQRNGRGCPLSCDAILLLILLLRSIAVNHHLSCVSWHCALPGRVARSLSRLAHPGAEGAPACGARPHLRPRPRRAPHALAQKRGEDPPHDHGHRWRVEYEAPVQLRGVVLGTGRKDAAEHSAAVLNIVDDLVPRSDSGAVIHVVSPTARRAGAPEYLGLRSERLLEPHRGEARDLLLLMGVDQIGDVDLR
eukprot:scaffold19698_cov125-Isochrysis_galbana.AAC.7